MMTIRRAGILALVVSLGCAGGAIGQSDEISAEAINAYARECILARKQMDLISRFGTDYRRLDLRGANFRGIHEHGLETILSGADFTGTDVGGAVFGAVRLDGAIFRDANLAGASFVTADLTAADFTGATFGDVRFQECNFAGALLPFADLSSATINAGRFPGADLSSAIFSGVKNELTWPDLTDANLQRADLSGVSLRYSRLAGADLTGADLRGADLTQADLTGAILSGALLDGVIVEFAIFDDVTGLDAATLADLQQRAGRSAFDRKQAVVATLRAIAGPAYLVVAILAVVVLLVPLIRSTARGWAVLLLVTNIAAMIPPGVLLYMGLVGAHPTAQLSGGAQGQQMWSFWFHFWPIAFFGSMAMIPVAAIACMWMITRLYRQDEARTKKWTRWTLAGSLLTGIHAMFLFRMLATYIPDA